MDIQWDIQPRVIQYGQQLVKLTASKASPNAKYKVKIVTPTEPPFYLEIESDKDGFITEQISLSSGYGRYNFFADEHCEFWNPQVISVIACQCPPKRVDSGCSLELFVNSTSFELGRFITVDVTGAAPGEDITLVYSRAGQLGTDRKLATGDGTATWSFEADRPGAFTFVAVQKDCKSEEKVATIIGNVNFNPTIGADNCTGQIIVTPRILSQAIDSGSNVTLLVTVTNNGLTSQVVNLSVPTPAGFTATVPVALSAEPVGPKSSREFYFQLGVVNTADDLARLRFEILPQHGSYECGGATRAIVGGVGNVEVNAARKAAGLEIVEFELTPNSVIDGQTVFAILRVRNIGTTALTNVSLTALTPPGRLDGLPFQFNGVPLAPGQEYTSRQSYKVKNGRTTQRLAVMTIPVGQLTGVGQGALVANSRSATASVSIAPSGLNP